LIACGLKIVFSWKTLLSREEKIPNSLKSTIVYKKISYDELWLEEKNREREKEHSFEIQPGLAGRSGTRLTRSWNRVEFKKKYGNFRFYW
jgi:hypothetical protein